MPKTVIDQVAALGEQAAELILKRFLGPAQSGQWQGWSFQRWIRLDVLIKALSNQVPGMERALGSRVPHSESYDQLFVEGSTSTPPCHDQPLSAQQQAAVTSLKQALEDFAKAFKRVSPDYPNEPVPEPEMRVGPNL